MVAVLHVWEVFYGGCYSCRLVLDELSAPEDPTVQSVGHHLLSVPAADAWIRHSVSFLAGPLGCDPGDGGDAGTLPAQRLFHFPGVHVLVWRASMVLCQLDGGRTLERLVQYFPVVGVGIGGGGAGCPLEAQLPAIGVERCAPRGTLPGCSHDPLSRIRSLIS